MKIYTVIHDMGGRIEDVTTFFKEKDATAYFVSLVKEHNNFRDIKEDETFEDYVLNLRETTEQDKDYIYYFVTFLKQKKTIVEQKNKTKLEQKLSALEILKNEIKELKKMVPVLLIIAIFTFFSGCYKVEYGGKCELVYENQLTNQTDTISYRYEPGHDTLSLDKIVLILQKDHEITNDTQIVKKTCVEF